VTERSKQNKRDQKLIIKTVEELFPSSGKAMMYPFENMCGVCRRWASDFVGGLDHCEYVDAKTIPGNPGSCLEKYSTETNERTLALAMR